MLRQLSHYGQICDKREQNNAKKECHKGIEQIIMCGKKLKKESLLEEKAAV